MIKRRNSKQTGNAGVACSPVRVLIVDDHPLFRDGLKDLLEGEPNLEICGEAADVGEALEQVRATCVNLVTVDISLASGSGIELVRQIKRVAPNTLVLVVSMYDDRLYAMRALKAGALGYLSKQASPGEILRAVRTVSAGRVFLGEEMMQRLLRRKAGLSQAEGAHGLDSLSDRELEVFRLIGLGYTTKQIACELSLAMTTIETYRERLKSKLALASSTELTRQATLWMLQNQ